MENKKKIDGVSLPAAILIAGVIIGGAVLYNSNNRLDKKNPIGSNISRDDFQLETEQEKIVIPEAGRVLPITWGNLGSKLVSVGAIDPKQFQSLYEERGQFTDEYKKLLFGQNDGKLKITRENSAYLLNLLWALGLASKNPILDSGEMTDRRYGGAGNFASTGGWTIAVGNPMDHYSRHKFFDLTSEQQALVDKVSRGIYRPCCNNSTHFPDCNHGMAMLGLLELMASQGVSEEEIWKGALTANSYWFPDTYLTIETYMKSKGVE